MCCSIPPRLDMLDMMNGVGLFQKVIYAMDTIRPASDHMTCGRQHSRHRMFFTVIKPVKSNLQTDPSTSNY